MCLPCWLEGKGKLPAVSFSSPNLSELKGNAGLQSPCAEVSHRLTERAMEGAALGLLHEV